MNPIAVRSALNRAILNVSNANTRIEQVLRTLHDPQEAEKIRENVSKELEAHPGWLDEIADLIKEDPD